MNKEQENKAWEQDKFPSIDDIKPGGLIQQNQITLVSVDEETGAPTYEAGDFFIAAWIPASKRGSGAYKKVLEGLIEILQEED